MASFFLRHVEKLVFLAVLLACGYWASSSLSTYRSAYVHGAEIKQDVEKVRQVLDTRDAQPLEPAPYIEEVRRIKAAQPRQPTTLLEVPDHVFWWQPAKGELEPVSYAQGVLKAPAELSVRAARGQIAVSWGISGVEYCVPKEVYVYRRREGQDHAERYYARVSADWPEPAAAIAPAPAAPAPPAAPAQEDVKKQYTYADKDVEPKAVYYYRVRVVARPWTHEEAKAAGFRGVVQPEDVEKVQSDGATYWLSGFSGEEKGRAPSNIKLAYRGSFGTRPLWRARVEVKQWFPKDARWLSFSSMAAEGERILASGPGQEGRGIEVDSGFQLVEIIEEMRYEEREEEIVAADGGREKRTIRVPYVLKAIKVREVDSGQEITIKAGEEYPKGEEATPAAEETRPTRPRTGRPRLPVD